MAENNPGLTGTPKDIRSGGADSVSGVRPRFGVTTEPHRRRIKPVLRTGDSRPISLGLEDRQPILDVLSRPSKTSTQITPKLDQENDNDFEVERYFNGDVPDSAMAYEKVRRYRKFESIPTSIEERRSDNIPDATEFEMQTGLDEALKISEPLKGESKYGSFRFKGNRLYIRVEREKEIDGKKETSLWWMRYNPDDLKPEEVLFT